jgi:glutathione S-transferase
MALVRKSPDYQDRDALAAGCRDWTRNMQILDRQLEKTGAYVSGEQFSLADIPIGLSVNRWFETPLDHGDLAAVRAYYDRLNQRDGYRLYGRNGTP